MTSSRIVAQLKMELRLTLSNGESLLLVLGIPLLLLFFFGTVDILPTDDVVADPIDFLVPGVLALAIMSTAFVNLAITTGFDRHYGVLKRLGTTPLTRAELLAAKTITLVIVESIQFIAIIGAGLALGWPHGDVGVVSAVAVSTVAALLATVAFSGLGFLLAGSSSGLVVLAAANAIYLVLLLASGLIFPLEEFGSAVRSLVRLLPSTALGEITHGAMREGATVPQRAWIVLAAWAMAAPTAASRRFRWTPA